MLHLSAILVIIAVDPIILLLLSLSFLLIKNIGIQYRGHQLILVCCAFNGKKIDGEIIARTNRRKHRGLRLNPDRTLTCCTSVVVQWLARGTKSEEGIMARGIGRQRFRFKVLQELCRLE